MHQNPHQQLFKVIHIITLHRFLRIFQALTSYWYSYFKLYNNIKCTKEHFNVVFLFYSYLGGTKKKNSSIIYQQFLGSMRIHTKKIMPADADPKKQKELEKSGEYDWKVGQPMFVCQLSVCQVSFRQVFVCQVSICQLSVCQVSVCQVSICQVSVCQFSVCQVSVCQVFFLSNTVLRIWIRIHKNMRINGSESKR